MYINKSFIFLQTHFTAVCRHTSAGNPLSLCIRYFLLNVLHYLTKPPDSVDYLKFSKWAQHFIQSEVSP